MPRSSTIGPLAHLTTLKRDATPQVTVVWIAVERR
jgi:hypothetical protein